MGELVARSEADLLDIRNFGAKSIDEVKAKLAGMGLALKDSPPDSTRPPLPTPSAPTTTRTRVSWRPSSTDLHSLRGPRHADPGSLTDNRLLRY